MIHRLCNYKVCHRMHRKALSGKCSGSTYSLQWADLLEPEKKGENSQLNLKYKMSIAL